MRRLTSRPTRSADQVGAEDRQEDAEEAFKAEPEGADGESDVARMEQPESDSQPEHEHEHENDGHDSEQLTEDEQPAEVAEMTRNS